jgi:hypothetical protein
MENSMQEEKNIKEEKYRKRRKRFLFIWFFFLSIFLATITYAWFSSNRIADLQFFDIHVETDGGLEISENAISWKTELTVDELKNAYKTYPSSLNQIPGIMKPMSSGGGIDANGYLNIFFGQADSNGTNDFYLTTYRKIEERTTEYSNEGDFIAFDVFFKTTAPKALYLSKESYVSPKEGETKGIENSARIAFIYEGNTSSDTALATVQKMKTNSENNVIMWEPNYDVHTAHGVSNARSIYGIETTTTNANILTYDGVIGTVTNSAKVNIKSADSKNYPNLFKKVKIDIYTKSAYDKNNYLFDLQPGITKMRIYMWLEGQDVDSENRASQGDISYKLQFTLNP